MTPSTKQMRSWWIKEFPDGSSIFSNTRPHENHVTTGAFQVIALDDVRPALEFLKQICEVEAIPEKYLNDKIVVTSYDMYTTLNKAKEALEPFRELLEGK